LASLELTIVMIRFLTGMIHPLPKPIQSHLETVGYIIQTKDGGILQKACVGPVASWMKGTEETGLVADPDKYEVWIVYVGFVERRVDVVSVMEEKDEMWVLEVPAQG